MVSSVILTTLDGMDTFGKHTQIHERKDHRKIQHPEYKLSVYFSPSPPHHRAPPEKRRKKNKRITHSQLVSPQTERKRTQQGNLLFKRPCGS
jgi:hypothetical protein